jgi:hypothetical protein
MGRAGERVSCLAPFALLRCATSSSYGRCCSLVVVVVDIDLRSTTHNLIDVDCNVSMVDEPWTLCVCVCLENRFELLFRVKHKLLLDALPKLDNLLWSIKNYLKQK